MTVEGYLPHSIHRLRGCADGQIRRHIKWTGNGALKRQSAPFGIKNERLRCAEKTLRKSHDGSVWVSLRILPEPGAQAHHKKPDICLWF